MQICARITMLLDKEILPSVSGQPISLLGAGRQSVMRTLENCSKERSLVDYCTRFHSMPLLDSNRKFTHNIGECSCYNIEKPLKKAPNQTNIAHLTLQLKFYMAANRLAQLQENSP